MQKQSSVQKKPKKKLSVSSIILLFLIFAVLLSFAVITVIRIKDKLIRERYPQSYAEIVAKYSGEYGLSKELVYALIRTESGFRPGVVSSAGAQGLMQIMPDTKEWIEFRLKISDETDVFDPETNIKYGTYLLSYFLNEFGNEKCALAAYNAGGNKVKSWLSDTRYSEDGITLKEIPYNETKNYVVKVADSKEMYQKLYNEEENQSN